MWSLYHLNIAIRLAIVSLMRTVQLTLDDDLVKQVDRRVAKLKTSRSAFAREALRQAIRKLETEEQERKWLEGYRKKPVRKGEFDVWHSEQVWPE